MSYVGTVSNGVIILPPEAHLDEGTKVKVEILENSASNERADKPVLSKLQALAGTLKDLPADFARNHDHYLHGTPKRDGK
jgi:hypothetical protein